MPTQRPFFANFFAAFRARTNPAFQAKSSTTTGAISPAVLSTSAHVSSASTNGATSTGTNPRSISTKAGSADSSSPTTTSTVSSPRPTAASPFSAAAAAAAALTSTSPGSAFYQPHHHLPRPTRPASPGPYTGSASGLAMSPPGGASTPLSNSRGRQRRGSDSSNSSGGLMDNAMGPDKWYIGGRTGGGDERFYRLGLVTGGAGKRVRSLDRLSM